MKIVELILNNFGKFRNQSFRLAEGINIVYGENGFGKSTIHAFVKGMLLGLDEKISDRYEPWGHSEEYSGTIKFDCDGKIYGLYRLFGKQEDDAMLVCEDTGKVLDVSKGELDTLLGKVNGIHYENTVSIAQRKAETTEELAAELKNYAANYHSRGTTEIQIEEVQQYLSNKKQELANKHNEEKMHMISQKEKLNLEHDYIKRELERLQTMLKENQKLETLQRAKQEKRNSSLNVPVLPCISVLVLTIPVMATVPRPWNVLTVIVMVLALGLYIWNKLKHKPIGRHDKKEISKEIEKVSWENKRLVSEIQEKEVVLENIEEQLKSTFTNVANEELNQKKIAGIELAMKRVEEVSHSIQKDFGILLNETATEIIKVITKQEYSKIEVSEELEVRIYRGKQLLTLEQVSRGTVEQVYFALRMAITTLLHTEELPILLDDTFAYYDDERLIEVLKWLHQNKKQVIIFTCHKREELLLKEIEIPYNLVK